VFPLGGDRSSALILYCLYEATMTICKQGAEDQPMEHSKGFTMMGKASRLTFVWTFDQLTRIRISIFRSIDT